MRPARRRGEADAPPATVEELMRRRVGSVALVGELLRCGPEFRRAVGWGTAAALVARTAVAGSAGLIAMAVDAKAGGAHVGAGTLGAWSLGAMCFAFVAAKIVETLCFPAQMLFSQRAEGYAESRFLDSAFASLLWLPRRSWRGCEVSEAMARLDLKNPLRNFVYCVWRGALPSLLGVATSTLALVALGMGAASLAVAAAAAVYVALSMWAGPAVERAAKNATKTRGVKDSTVANLLGSIDLARAYGAKGEFAAARAKGAAGAARSRSDLALSMALADASSWLALVGGASAAFAIGLSAYESGKAGAGAFAALMAVSAVALVGMKNLAYAFAGVVASGQELSFAAAAIRETRRCGWDGRFAPQEAPAAVADLRVAGLSASYHGAPGLALDGVGFELPAGGKIYLVGSSGSGKTTLMRVLSGFMPAEEGSASFGGADLLGESPPAACAWMPQEADAVAGGARLNLSLGSDSADEARMELALREAGLMERVAMGGGLDAPLGEGAGKLSGGERARLAFARALVSGRPLLLLDEPTSALDARSERALIDLVEQRSGLSAIVSIHRIRAIPAGARVAVMSKGRWVQDGSLEELIASPGEFKDLWASSSMGSSEESEGLSAADGAAGKAEDGELPG